MCTFYSLNVGKTPNWPNDYKHYLPKNRHLIHKGIVWLCRGYQNDGKKGTSNGQYIKHIILIGLLFRDNKIDFASYFELSFFNVKTGLDFLILPLDPFHDMIF